MDAVFANIKPISWQVELDQGVTEFYLDANFATVKPIDKSNQHQTNQLALRIRPGHHWICCGRQLCHCQPNRHITPIDWQLELDQGVAEVYVDANFAKVEPIDMSNQLTGK